MARTTPKSASAATAGPATKGLRVAHKGNDSFWRGGQEFTGQARTIALDMLTPEQADEIRDEGDKPGGWLVVTEVDIDPAGA